MIRTGTLKVVWRSLGRNRRRTLLALTAIAVGQFAFLSVAGLMNGYSREYQESVTGPLIGHIQVHAPNWRQTRAIDETVSDVSITLEAIRRDPNVSHAAARIFAPAMVAIEEEGFTGVGVGLDPQAESHPRGLLGDGAQASELGGHQALVGRLFARKHGIEVGDEIAIIGQDVDGSIANDLFRVSGLISSSVEVVVSMGIVLSLADARELFRMSDDAHEIVIHARDPERLGETIGRLSTLAPLAGTEVLSWQRIVPHMETFLEMAGIWRLIILMIVFISALAGIMNTMLMSTFERTHEFGMLLSLGCSSGRLGRMIAGEAVLLGLVGALAGTLLGCGLVISTAETGVDYGALGGSDESIEMAYKGLQMSTRIVLHVEAVDIAFGFGAVVLTSLIAAIWPVVHVARLEPMEALRA